MLWMTADGNLFQLSIFEVHSSSEDHWTNAWKCSHTIGIHQLISSCTVVVRQLNNDMFQATGRPHRLSPINRVMLFMLWMRSYPSCHILSLFVDVSVTTGFTSCFEKWISVKWRHLKYIPAFPRVKIFMYNSKWRVPSYRTSTQIITNKSGYVVHAIDAFVPVVSPSFLTFWRKCDNYTWCN
jgi:hypothetical protein